VVPELISGVPLVIRRDRDADLVEVTAGTAGPAGALSLSFGGGRVELDVDGADIDRLVDVRLETGDGVDPVQQQILERVFGPDTTRRVASATGRADRVAGQPGRGRVDERLTLAVALADDAVRPGRLPVQRAVTSLAAWGLLHELGLPGSQADMPLTPGAAVEAIVSTSGTLHLAGLPAAARRQVHAALRSALPVLDIDASTLLATALTMLAADEPEPVRRPLLFASRAWDASFEVPAADGMMYSSMSDLEPMRPRRAPIRVAAHTLAGPVADGPEPDVRWSGDGNIEVRLRRFAGRATGWWARAFRDSVPIAAAPLSDDGEDLCALLLVPDGEMVVVDIVEDFGAPIPSLHAAAFERAVAYGRQAARAERTGNPVRATERWRQCAEAHDTAHDTTRSKLARTRTTSRSRVASRPPLRPAGAHVADLLSDRT
jgi:hypothetical protein